MTLVTNGRLLFNEIPTGYPEPGKTTVYDTSKTIDIEKTPLNGGFLIKTLVLSIDPFLRGKMRDKSEKLYSVPFVIGESLYNYGVGVVLRSENSAFKAGDHLYGKLPFEHYFIGSDVTKFSIIDNKVNLPWSVYVGAAGMPGMSAFAAWKEYADVQKGDIVFVSGGAGPVGSMVVQLAKQDGLKVIASAGSEDKVKFLQEIGADVAFNYKTTSTRDILEKEGPINIYWDNVGGETLDLALKYSAPFARFLECGMISTYNGQPYAIKNLFQVCSNSIKMIGFLVFDLEDKYRDEFFKFMPPKLISGELKYTEDLTRGLEYAGHAIRAVQNGKSTGKSVVIVADN